MTFIYLAAQALALMFTRPSGRQVAALCLRDGKVGKDVLLVCSLQSDRWIIPKGWSIAGKDFPNAALAEAWEEAGVRTGRVQNEKIG
jgi:8-oxo-dGTP pyrophosphatase MutT (NUDIX family)